MNYIKTLALLISLSTLASCSEAFEDAPKDVYTTLETKATDPTDSIGAGNISLYIDEIDVEDIDYTITIP